MSEVPKGYKQTEVGLIPEDWEVKELGELCSKIGSGITPKGGAAVYQSHGIPFVRSQNIGWGVLRLDDLTFITNETHQSFNSTEIKTGDVFINISGASIGRSAIARNTLVGGNVNQHVCIIRPIKKLLDSNYICAVILSQIGQSQVKSFQSGGNREGLNFGQIKTFLVPLPPTLAEQEAIAKVLSDMDGQLQAQDELIAKKRQVKQATMEALLTGRQRLSGFGEGKGMQNTELGEIPEDWEVRSIGDSFHILKNATYSRADTTTHDPIGYVHYGDIHTQWDNHLDINKDTLPKISLEKAQRFSFVHEGDLILADASEDIEGVGKALEIINIGKHQIIAGLHTVLLRPKANYFAPKYKGYFHANPLIKRQYQALANGLKVYGLSKSNLINVLIPLPPTLAEQRAIAEVLQAQDAELEALAAQRAKYAEIKTALLEDLLTGKRRVHDLQE